MAVQEIAVWGTLASFLSPGGGCFHKTLNQKAKNMRFTSVRFTTKCKLQYTEFDLFRLTAARLFMTCLT